MRVHGWCELHEKMVDKIKFKNKCHTSGRKRCRHFSFQIPQRLQPQRKKAEGYGEFRSRD